MSDDQVIVLAAAILMLSSRYDASSEESLRIARELFAENKKLGPLPTQALPETRKATLSHPTVADRNEAHAEREYNKRMGK